MISNKEILLSLRRESRITPAMGVLLCVLCALVPLVCCGGKWWAAGIGGLLSLAIGVLLSGRGFWKLTLVYLGALGWLSFWLVPASDDYSHYLLRSSCSAEVQLFITGNPRPPDPEKGTKHLCEVRAIKGVSGWRVCSGVCLVEFPPEVRLRYGQRYHTRGYFSEVPDDPDNGYASYLHSCGVVHIYHVQSASLQPDELTWCQRGIRSFMESRERLGEALGLGMSKPNSDLYQAMILGRKDLFSSDIKESFIRSSTIHIFAISGLHVGIIYGFIWLCLGMFGMSSSSRAVVGALVCVAYVYLTEPSPSSMRSCLTILLLLLPTFLRRAVNSRNSLCLAALVLLMFQPRVITHTGFLFSFAVTASLIYGWGCLNDVCSVVNEPTQWRLHNRWRTWSKNTKLWLVRIAGGILLAWFASVPLTLQYNGLIPFGSLPVNLLAQFLAQMLVFCAIPKVLISLIWARATLWAGGILDWTMSALTFLAQAGSGAFWCRRCMAMPSWSVGVYYCAFVGVLCGWHIRVLRYSGVIVVLGWLVWCFIQPVPGLRVVIVSSDRGGCPAVCLLDSQRNAADILLTGDASAAAEMCQELKRQGVGNVENAMISSSADAYALKSYMRYCEIKAVRSATSGRFGWSRILDCARMLGWHVQPIIRHEQHRVNTENGWFLRNEGECSFFYKSGNTHIAGTDDGTGRILITATISGKAFAVWLNHASTSRHVVWDG